MKTFSPARGRRRRHVPLVLSFALVAGLVAPLAPSSAVAAVTGPLAGEATVDLTGQGAIAAANFVDVAYGQAHGVGLTSDGRIYTWGDPAFGVLGNGPESSFVTHPTEIVAAVGSAIAGKRFVDVDSYRTFSMALASDGTLFAWGRNSNGQLGDGTTSDRDRPVQVINVPAIRVGGDGTIAAGGESGYAIAAATGAVWSWGHNANGELGRNMPDGSLPAPGQVDASSGVMRSKAIARVDAGLDGVFFTGLDGDIYGAGKNAQNELLASPASALQRAPVLTYDYSERASARGSLAGRKVLSISKGTDAALALTSAEDGSDVRVETWGTNTDGVLGDGTTVTAAVPRTLVATGSPLAGKTVVSAAMGAGFAAARTSDGAVLTWGKNEAGRLGHGSVNGLILRPAVSGFVQATRLVLDAVSLAVVRDDGSIWQSGTINGVSPSYLGRGLAPAVVVDGVPVAASRVTVLGADSIRVTMPARPRPGRAEIAVRAIGRQTVFRDAFSYVRPAASISSLTPARANNASAPPVVIDGTNFATALQFVDVDVSSEVSVAVDADGAVWVWGQNPEGLIGTGTVGSVSRPARISPVLFGSKRIVSAQTGTLSETSSSSFLALADDGTVFTWGNNDFGQLGDGTQTSRATPVALPASTWQNKRIVQTSRGGRNGLALAEDGTVFSWGDGARGAIGDGAQERRRAPVPLSAERFLGKRVIEVASDVGPGDASFAMTSDGVVFGWGRTDAGQLARISNSDVTSPERIRTEAVTTSPIIDIAVGVGHVVALAADGTVVNWGWNAYRQVSGSTATDVGAVLRVDSAAIGSDVVAVGAGSRVSWVRKADGQVYAWGSNPQGALGASTPTTFASPTAIPAAQLPAGGTATIALSESRAVVVGRDGTVRVGGKVPAGNGATSTPEGYAPLDETPLQAVRRPVVTIDGVQATVTGTSTTSRITAVLGDRTGRLPGRYAVAVAFADGSVASSAADAFTYYGPPQPPTSLVASTPAGSGNAGSVDLAWTAVPNASATAANGFSTIMKYVVQYREAGTSGAFSVADDGGAPMAATRRVSGLVDTKEYDFRVCAVNEAVDESAPGASCASTMSSVRPQFVELAAAVTPVGATFTPSVSGAVTEATSQVAVSTNNPNGYRLTVTASTPALARDGGGGTIPAVSGTAASPVSLTGSTYGWGYLVNPTSRLWAAVPTGAGTAATVGSSSAPVTNSTSTVTFGFRTPATQPSGVYKTTITYTAVVN